MGKKNKMDREKAFQQVRENEKKDRPYHVKIQMLELRLNYIRNLINGRYFLARYNMLATQLINKEIKEMIDGCLKSEEYMASEAALVKMQAINSMRTAHFMKKELLEKFKVTTEELQEWEKDYYDGKIVREAYDEDLEKAGKKAKFVETDEKA